MPYSDRVADIAPEDDLLLRAAEEVRKGWCQYEAEDAAGNVCVVGAFRRVAEELFGRPYGYSGGMTKLQRTIGGSPIKWNNAPGRTAEEVAQMMERAAGVEQPAAMETV